MHEFTREDYEHAARAAGYPVVGDLHPPDGVNVLIGERTYLWWPPLDDGDALRLAVKLEIEVRNFNGASHAGKQGQFWCTEKWFPDGDPYAATRHAIFRAAIEIGKSMKGTP